MIEWTGERFIPWMKGGQIHYEHLHRYLFAAALVEGKVVLDLACGEGYGAYFLAERAAQVLGVDRDKETIEHASSRYIRPNLTFRRGSMESIPVEGSALFDVVVCFEALEHTDQHEAVMDEIKRVLKPNGFLIISTPNRAEYTERTGDQNPYHLKELSLSEFLDLLEGHFNHVQLFGQRVYAGSHIWELLSTKPRGELLEQLVEREREDREFHLAPGYRKAPMYFIALASDAGIPVRYERALLIDVGDWLLQEPWQRVRDLEQRIGELKAEHERQIREHKDREQALKGELAEQEERVRTLREQLKRWESENLALQNQLAGREGALAQLKEQLSKLQAEHDHLMQKHEEREQALKNELIQAQKQLQALETRSVDLLRQLEGREAQIRNLECELAKREEELSFFREEGERAKGQLREREERERALRSELAHLQEQLREAQAYIAAVQSSIGWRIMERIRHLYLWLFPPSTRRGQWFALFLAALRVWSNEGFKALINRVIARVRWRIKYETPIAPPSGVELPDINAQYEVWLEKNKLTPEKVEAMAKEQQDFAYKPKISIITPVYNTDERWLRKAIESVRAQIYPNWELCLVDDGSTKPDVKAVLEEYRRIDDRIKVEFLEKNGGIAEATNRALAMATGEFVGFLDHDDELTLDALFEVVKLLNQNSELDIIYSDEDKIDQNGRRCDPFFKPDWSPDLLLSTNYICHFLVIRKSLIEKVGRLRRGFDGAQDYDLLLRVTEHTNRIAHIPKVLYSWRKVPGSAALSFEYKNYAHEAGQRALEEALQRRGIEGTVQSISAGRYAVRYKIRGTPLVSIIIPTKDQVQLLRKCVESIKEKTRYRNYELVIIDNNTSDPEALRYLEKLAHKHCVLKFPEAFNWSKINNFGAANCEGEYLLFLNNDVEVKEPGWLTAMLEHAQRPEVGAVGAKLLHPIGTIQHVGVILGMGSDRIAGHPFHGTPERALMGYMPYLQAFVSPRNYCAVTGACMMLRRQVFDQLKGFDVKFQVAYGDVDFCLRLLNLGYFIVFTPLATLIHQETATRSSVTPQEDIECMLERWGTYIERGDPFYNPNLALDWPRLKLSSDDTPSRS